MDGWIPGSLRGVRRADWVPFLGALTIATVGAVEIGRADELRPLGLYVAILTITSGALVVAGRRPLWVLALVLALWIPAVTHDSNYDPTAFAFFASALAAFYLGAHGSLRSVAVGVAGIIVFQIVYAVLYRDDAPGALVQLVAVGLGYAFRARKDRADLLEAETARLARERDERARAAVLDERARIARELHDSVAHTVSTMVLQVGGVRRLLAPEQEREREVLASVERAGRQAVDELRRMLGILRASDPGDRLDPQPSLACIGELIERMREAGVAIELRIEGEPRALPTGVDLSAYRIVQEALNNVAKHAGDARAEVTVRYGANDVGVGVLDDGGEIGVHGPAGTGHGLVGMRERVALYGGTLEAGPQPGGGFEVRAVLPLGAQTR